MNPGISRGFNHWRGTRNSRNPDLLTNRELAAQLKMRDDLNDLERASG